MASLACLNAPMTPPPSSPQPAAKALPQVGLPTPPDSPPTQHAALFSSSPNAPARPAALASEVVTILGAFDTTNALAHTLSLRHCVTQLDPAYARHLNPAVFAGSSYIVISLQDTDLPALLAKIQSLIPQHATVVLDGSIGAGVLRTSVGPTLAANGIRVGLVTLDAEGPVVSGLDSFAPGAASATAWMCEGIWANVHTVSSPEAAECLVRFREGRRRLMQAWEGEMRAFCEDAGVDSSEILPTPTPPTAPVDAPVDAPIRAEQDWQGSMVEAAVTRIQREPVEKALRLIEDVRAVKDAEGHDPLDTAKILVLGEDAAFVEELCSAKNVTVSVVSPTPVRGSAQRFDGVWTAQALTQFDAVAVLDELAGDYDMRVLEEADGDGVFVEWLC